MEDKPLFGPVDQVVNTLECEMTWVKGEIRRCEKAIERNKSEIGTLETRHLDDSVRIVRKKAKEERPAPATPKASGFEKATKK